MSTFKLSEEQERVLQSAIAGENILVTGSAGTGKSTLLRALQGRFPDLPVTASTGIAAVNVGGSTINSWAGLGLAQEPPEVIVEKITEMKGGVLRRIKKAQRLAIDEVSMIHAELLDLLDYVFRHIREDMRPFGGVQLIMFGDFLQLPPVSKDKREKLFAFQADSWANANVRVAMLNKCFRQEDAVFSGVLNKVRVGNMDAEVIGLLKSRLRAPDADPEVEPVTVYTHNEDVERMNAQRLRQIQGEEKVWKSQDWGEPGPLGVLQKNCLAPEYLTLKVGAQVMLLWNIETWAGLANGSIGTVVEMKDNPIVRFRNGMEREIEKKTWEIKMGGDVLAFRTQVPLRLAWAITAHKSQGMTLDKIAVHLDKAFEYGQSYVALSRSRTLEGLYIHSSKQGCIKAHPAAVKFYEECAKL